MKNMKIKAKMLTQFIIIALFTAIVGITGTLGLRTLDASQTRIYTYGANANLSSRLDVSLNKERNSYRQALIFIQNDAERNAALAELDINAKSFDETFATLKARLLTQTGKDFLAEIEKQYYTTFTPVKKELTAAINRKDLNESLELLEDISIIVDDVEKSIVALSTYAIDLADTTNDHDTIVARRLELALIAFSILAVAIAVIIGMSSARSISEPIKKLSLAANSLSKGDINVNVETNLTDEIGELSSAFVHMIDGIKEQAKVLNAIADGDFTISLPPRSEFDVINTAITSMLDSNNKMMGELSRASSQVTSGADQIAQGAQSLAAGSTQQAATLEEFSASIGRTLNQTLENAETSKEALKLSGQSGELLDQSMIYMQEMLKSMQSIDESSRSITKVIKVIEDIAFQTNILALNAAVEAARAGQHGKGFAVVADEVRNLASKSAAAAQETAALIQGSSQRVTEGNQIVEKTDQSLRLVVDYSAKSVETINTITRVSNEQSSTMSDLNTGIDQVSQVVHTNSATAEQSAAAAEEMAAQAAVLSSIVGRFKIRAETMTNSDYDSYTPRQNSSPRSYNMPQDNSYSSGFAVSQNDKY